MIQTTATSRRLTADEAGARTAQLIAECPEWCTEKHDPNSHPEDVRHSRVVGETAVGKVVVYAWATPLENEPTTGVYVQAARFDGERLGYGDVMSVADAMIRAANTLKGVESAACARAWGSGARSGPGDTDASQGLTQ